MKRTIANHARRHAVSTLMLTMLSCAGTAWAQADNVTVYGRLAVGIDYQDNVATGPNTSGSLLRAADNQWGTSIFGMKGQSHLGGNLNAFFLLESGFQTPKGRTNGSAFFNRRSYVGLRGDAGAVRFGKNLAISNDVYYLDPTGQQFIGSATLVRGRNWAGADNVVEYETPDLGGFNARLQTSLGERPGSLTAGRKDGVSLTYARANYEVRAIYEAARDPDGRYTSVFTHSKDLIVGGTARFDGLKLFAGYENLRASDALASEPSRAHHYWLGANYQITPALTLIGSVFRVHANRGGGQATLLMLGANYALSHRTLLYAGMGAVRNSDNANFSVEASDNRPLPGQGQRGGYAGIVHTF